MARITEETVSAQTLEGIKECAGDAAKFLELAIPCGSASQVVQAVDDFVFNWQKGLRPMASEGDDLWGLSLTIGSLWGEQLVDALDWQWGGVTFHDQADSKAIGVLSPNRSLAIYPFHFVYCCFANDVEVTIMLAYNMLIDGSRVPPLPPNSYHNVMDYVHRIVPRS